MNSLVTYRGVDVGVVKSIDVRPDRASAELQLDSDFAVPANSQAFAELSQQDNPQSLQIYDLTGRLRAEQLVPSFESRATLDVQLLEPGMYLVVWNINGGSPAQFKLVIQ